MRVLPLFTSAYSFKSILTEKEVFAISQREGIEKPVFIEKNMASLPYIKKAFGEEQYIFGLSLYICNERGEEYAKSLSKIYVIASNKKGYEDLMALYSKGYESYDTKRHGPVYATSDLQHLWSPDLSLLVPFYDNFLWQNIFLGGICAPDFSSYNPTFALEDNGLYQDAIAREVIASYCKENNFNTLEAQSIYYDRNEDFLAWQTYMCIQKRTDLQNPNLEGCASDRFSVENWRLRNGND